MRLTEKRRLPEDTTGERIVTPFGEIHIEARTLHLIGNWDLSELPGNEVEKIVGALMYDLSAGFISRGLAEEINKRLGRVLRGKPARLTRSRGGAA